MHRPTEGRHKADKRVPSTGSRTSNFLRLARTPRETFPSHHAAPMNSRLIQFVRISRGRLA